MTDLWMYQYHKPKYTGIVDHFFETIRLILEYCGFIRYISIH